MTVILKQYTHVTADGRAVPEGHPDSAFVVGPKGATISDKLAVSLGLFDGNIEEVNPQKKEMRFPETKEMPPDKNKEVMLSREDTVKKEMRKMEVEANANEKERPHLFTNSGSPDAYVLTARLGNAIDSVVSAKERNELWVEMQE